MNLGSQRVYNDFGKAIPPVEGYFRVCYRQCAESFISEGEACTWLGLCCAIPYNNFVIVTSFDTSFSQSIANLDVYFIWLGGPGPCCSNDRQHHPPYKSLSSR